MCTAYRKHELRQQFCIETNTKTNYCDYLDLTENTVEKDIIIDKYWKWLEEKLIEEKSKK